MYSHLFLYNILKRGGLYNGLIRIMGGTFVGTAWAQGYSLYLIGPKETLAAVCRSYMDRWQKIDGELWVVPGHVIEKLDSFELVAAGMFQRQLVPIIPRSFYLSADPMLAEMYVWNQPIPVGSRQIHASTT